ncbi:Ldh family oxidoreductase [Pelagibius marinus]|uniref:Ldh family oxidoreductase n=1 Tax=Pelagibius marinus TaxID=2762760 RepID=UPI0018726F6F|nr:Ldh family oxidoreductase [Pelagibius marinus]
MAEITVSFNEALAAAVAALKAAGASPEQAAATARAVVTAEAEGNRGVGLKHLFTYGDALAAGRAKGEAEPVIEAVTEVVTRVDAAEGLPHLGFERALPRLAEGARKQGLALLALSNGYPCGALGYFARKLAEEHGLAALAAANAGPAVMAASGGRTPVFCTNPIAFAVPTGPGGPNGEALPALVIDQSSSSASLAKLREYAEAGREIPEGWGLDPAGHPTTDARAALAGSLLPFGGARGANIALMVEMLAAGLTGANWSKDAPAYNKGNRSPGAGLFILAVSPQSGFHARLHDWFEAVQADEGVHLPGLAKGEALHHARHRGFTVDADLWTRVKALA